MKIDIPEEKIDGPAHYGGKNNPYEAIKVIEAWNCNFNVGSALKYLSRAGKKHGESDLDDLRKAAWYVQREIERRTNAASTFGLIVEQVPNIDFNGGRKPLPGEEVCNDDPSDIWPKGDGFTPGLCEFQKGHTGLHGRNGCRWRRNE